MHASLLTNDTRTPPQARSEGSRFLRGKAAFLLAFAGGSKEFPLTQRGFDHAA